MRIGLAVVILTQLMQQLSGINAVMYYSTDILSDVIPTGARYISLLVAIANCVLTLAPILLVAWAGRKKLLLMSAALCSLNTMVLGIGIRTNSSFLSTCGVIAFVSSFSLGMPLRSRVRRWLTWIFARARTFRPRRYTVSSWSGAFACWRC